MNDEAVKDRLHEAFLVDYHDKVDPLLLKAYLVFSLSYHAPAMNETVVNLLRSVLDPVYQNVTASAAPDPYVTALVAHSLYALKLPGYDSVCDKLLALQNADGSFPAGIATIMRECWMGV